jgi:hypothetical protein
MMLGTADHLPALPGSAAHHARAQDLRIPARAAALWYRHGRDPEQLALCIAPVGAPTLIVHGTADDVVRTRHCDR